MPKNFNFEYKERSTDEERTTEAPFSNEAGCFPYLYEHIANIDGKGIGTGFDQMLDLMVNTKLDSVDIINIDPNSMIPIIALLEVGVKYREINGRYPIPQDLVNLTIPKNFSYLNVVLESFTAEDITALKKQINRKFGAKSDFVMHKYLKWKLDNPVINSWISSSENLHIILAAYESGRIRFIQGDLTSQDFQATIEHYGITPEDITLTYISNIESYYLDPDYEIFDLVDRNNFLNNIAILCPNGVVISTHSPGDDEPQGTLEIYEYIERDINYHDDDYYLQRWQFWITTASDLRERRNKHYKVKANKAIFRKLVNGVYVSRALYQ